MSDTTDALESLLDHPGWRILRDHARAEWATRERNGRKSALNDTDDKRALDKLRQITAAQEAVEWVLELPAQEIARLKRQELLSPSSTPTRAGQAGQMASPSGPMLAGMSRRGTL